MNAPALRTTTRLALAPPEVRANTFVRAFSDCLRDGGFETVAYGYEPGLPPEIRGVVMHWPNLFFGARPPEERRLAEHVLQTWQEARSRAGVRFFWVAHNLHPHDLGRSEGDLRHEFLAALDGIIYLSHDSRAEIHAAYRPQVAHELVSRHGHYRDRFTTRVQPWPPVGDRIRLGYVGRIRPYKGLESLLTASSAADIPDLELAIAGFRHDAAYAKTIEALASRRTDVRLDMRDAFLPEAELEAAIDGCHGIVLPYRSILNSGATLLALSRDRPVLAPRLGGLREIQEHVGSGWLQLYDGELCPMTLRSFVDGLRRHPGGTCNLAAYEWGPIGIELCRFIDGVCRS